MNRGWNWGYIGAVAFCALFWATVAFAVVRFVDGGG